MYLITTPARDNTMLFWADKSKTHKYWTFDLNEAKVFSSFDHATDFVNKALRNRDTQIITYREGVRGYESNQTKGFIF